MSPDRALGRRYPLLLYQRVAARHRRPAFLLALLLISLWLLVYRGWVDWPSPSKAPWLLAGGAVASLYWVLTLLAPRFAYAQPRENHLRLRTPIYRLQISYRRMLSSKPLNLSKTFSPGQISRAELNLLAPFMNQPALGLELRSYPMRRWLMRLFFHRLFFMPDRTGFVLIVDDWMKLSEQLSDQLEGWRGEDEAKASQHAYSDAARILAADPASDD